MYVEMANQAVHPGGNIVITGYPNLVEESGRWSRGWLEGNRCSRIRRSDTAMLRSAAGYLNEQIALLSNELSGTNDVTFTFVDTSQVYENDETGRHGLCTGQPWINGLTVDPDRATAAFSRSFHPTQLGHDALGTRVAEIVSTLSWSNLNRQPPIVSSAVLTSCEGTDLSMVDGDLAQPVVCSFPWGLVETTTTLGDGPAVIVSVLNTLERTRTGRFDRVEDGAALSGYTIEAVAEAGPPLDVAELLFNELDACSGCGTSEATTAPEQGPAACIPIDTVMTVGMDGPDPEVLLLQTKLIALGYLEDEADGYFGPNTWAATVESQAPFSDGTSGGNSIFADEQTVLEPAFERLGVSCSPDSFTEFQVFPACTAATQGAYHPDPYDPAGVPYFCESGVWTPTF